MESEMLIIILLLLLFILLFKLFGYYHSLDLFLTTL